MGAWKDDLLANLPPPAQQELSMVEELDQLLADHYQDAVQAWPDLSLPWDTFAPYLAERLAVQGDIVQGLRKLQAADLYLCCCCAQQDQEAMAAFHRQHLRTIEAVLRKLRLSDSLAEDVRQQLVQRLLIGDHDQQPLLEKYHGMGRLGSWLQIVTARLARKILHREKRLVPIDDDRFIEQLVQQEKGSSAADLAEAKKAYRKAFKQAFKHALSQLPPREISLLRYRFADGLSLQEIGDIYRVHQSTASRWLEKGRMCLLDHTREQLRQQLSIDASQCDSIMRLIQTNLDMTLQTFFGTKRDRENE